MTSAAIRTLMQDALKDTEVGSKTMERGNQRSIAAVMYAVADLTANSGLNYSLGIAAHNKEIRGTIVEKMQDYFSIAATDTDEMDDDETTQVRSEYDRSSRQLKKSVLAACFMEYHDVYVEHFNVTDGCYIVPTHCMYPEKGIPLGRLSEEPYIALDRRSFSYKAPLPNGKLKTRDKYASVAHFMLISGPPKKERKPKVQGEPALKVIAENAEAFNNPTTLATRAPLETVISALHILLLEDGTTKDELLPRDSLSDSAWNMLSAIMQKIDESRASWSKAAQAKAA